MQEGNHIHFVRIVTALSALQQSIADKFFNGRLAEKIQEFISGYLEYRIKAGKEDDVAQYKAGKEYIINITRLGEFLEELEYLKIGKPTPLLVSRDRLLRHKLALLKKVAERKVPVPVRQEAVPARPAVTRSAKTKSKRVNPTAEKILSFVKGAPGVRTKEIVSEFSALSDRTVKRMLKELTRQGFLKKESEHKAVHYSAN